MNKLEQLGLDQVRGKGKECFEQRGGARGCSTARQFPRGCVASAGRPEQAGAETSPQRLPVLADSPAIPPSDWSNCRGPAQALLALFKPQGSRAINVFLTPHLSPFARELNGCYA